ncbi:MAG: hypothetical protein WBL05_11885, partial [Brooklawnia sp.]|uniref:hypothetical protein n=1 Tax=Brooklawnia sp. TaxID=2699740 RepID=UPI003C78E725
PTSPQPATQPAPGLPWTTAGQAAEGYPAGAGEDESQPGAQPAGHAPDWTPAKRPPGADV